MKLHYVNEGVADADDYELQQMIAGGFVPETCLMGGQAVRRIVQAGRRPCEKCWVPRAKCKGPPPKVTPTEEDVDVGMRVVINDGPAARRERHLEMASHIRHLCGLDPASQPKDPSA